MSDKIDKTNSEKLSEDNIRRKLYGREYAPESGEKMTPADSSNLKGLSREIDYLRQELSHLRDKVELLNRQKIKLQKKVLQQRMLKKLAEGYRGNILAAGGAVALILVLTLVFKLSAPRTKARVSARIPVEKSKPQPAMPTPAKPEKKEDSRMTSEPAAYYAVQLAEYDQVSLADKLAQKFKNEGYPAAVYTAGNLKGRARVYLGKFPTKSAAEEMLADFKQRHPEFKDSFIRLQKE